MKLYEVYSFAGKCLALDEYPDFSFEIREKLNSSEVNKDDLIWHCSNHLVLPALYLKFRKYGLADVFPDEYSEQLQEIYERNRDSNLKILEQMDEISTLLGHAGIPHIYLKGAGNLLDNVYSDVGERMIGDIDFLVAKKDLVKTTWILMEQGYLTPLQTIGVDFSPPDHHHFPRLTKKHEPATAEVHHIPVTKQYSKQFTSEMIFAERKSIPGKTHVFVPSDKHKFIHNFIHCQFSNKGHRHWNPSLRGLYDGYLLSKKVNPQEITDAAQDKTGVKVFYNLLSRIFHLKEVHPFLQFISACPRLPTCLDQGNRSF